MPRRHSGEQVQLYPFFNLGARCGWPVKATFRPLYPPDGPQGRSGHVEKRNFHSPNEVQTTNLCSECRRYTGTASVTAHHLLRHCPPTRSGSGLDATQFNHTSHYPPSVWWTVNYHGTEGVTNFVAKLRGICKKKRQVGWFVVISVTKQLLASRGKVVR